MIQRKGKEKWCNVKEKMKWEGEFTPGKISNDRH